MKIFLRLSRIFRFYYILILTIYIGLVLNWEQEKNV